MPELLIAAGWCVSGFFAYGLTYRYFQQMFPSIAAKTRGSDRRLALFMAACGPIGLAVAFFSSGCGRHGLQWK